MQTTPTMVGILDFECVRGPVVVIDVLRAFATAAYALVAGASSVVLVKSLDAARAMQAHAPELRTVTDGPPAPGIDFVNSPGYLRSADVAGRTLVQKTMNATVGALAAKNGTPIAVRLLRHRRSHRRHSETPG
jgi:2-phosphosulfolactate phosphatase